MIENTVAQWRDAYKHDPQKTSQLCDLIVRTRPVPPRLLAAVRVRRPKLGLSPRERQVMHLVSEGLSNDEIGHRLYTSPETVKVQVRCALRKLEARNRTDGAVRFFALELLAGMREA